MKQTLLSQKVAAFALAVAGIFIIGTATSALASTFSVAGGPGGAGGAGPSSGGFPPDALFAPSGLVTPPPSAILVLPGAGPLPPGPGMGDFIEVDAFSLGRPLGDLGLIVGFEFSVDGPSVGAAGTAVFGESAGFDHLADIFGSAGGGGNIQILDGDGVATPGAATSMGLLEAATSGLADDTDGWDNRGIPGGLGMVFYSVDFATVGLGIGFGSAADIYLGPQAPGYDAPPPGLYATALALGLAPGDNIDALVVFDDGDFVFTPGTDSVLFSLAPGSPTLGPLTPADLLISSGGVGLFLPEAALGLVPGDNVDALDVVIPEPGTATLLGLGTLLLCRRVRRKRS